MDATHDTGLALAANEGGARLRVPHAPAPPRPGSPTVCSACSTPERDSNHEWAAHIPSPSATSLTLVCSDGSPRTEGGEGGGVIAVDGRVHSTREGGSLLPPAHARTTIAAIASRGCVTASTDDRTLTATQAPTTDRSRPCHMGRDTVSLRGSERRSRVAVGERHGPPSRDVAAIGGQLRHGARRLT